MVKHSEHLLMRDLVKGLNQTHIGVTIPVTKDQDTTKWFKDKGLNLVRLIDPPAQGIAAVEPLREKQGYAWLTFNHGVHTSQDTWYFHKADSDLAMLFKLTWHQ